MSMRQLVSYDDLSTPRQTSPEARIPSQLPKPSPSKKRRKSGQKPKKNCQPWDDRSNREEAMEYDENGVDDTLEVEEDSRELTHEEIWDDSALVDAWNAAAEEYEMYHGPSKDWKTDAVNKSPLWYNVPFSPSQKASQTRLAPTQREAEAKIPSGDPENDNEDDSRPLNFDTFVPSYDPSLELPIGPHPPSVPGPDYSSYYLPEQPGTMVSEDEAFTRALGAMYWGGYWTAVYHCHRNLKRQSEHEGEEIEDGVENDNEEEKEFLSTQR